MRELDKITFHLQSWSGSLETGRLMMVLESVLSDGWGF
jgi:hypothetical protein